MLEFFVEKVLPAVVILLLAFIVYGIYESSTAEKFALRKDSWVCTEQHTETTMMLVGKVMVPQSHNICDNWKRK